MERLSHRDEWARGKNKERKNKSQHRGGAPRILSLFLGRIKQPDKLPVYFVWETRSDSLGAELWGGGLVAGGSCEWLGNSGGLVRFSGVAGAQGDDIWTCTHDSLMPRAQRELECATKRPLVQVGETEACSMPDTWCDPCFFLILW